MKTKATHRHIASFKYRSITFCVDKFTSKPTLTPVQKENMEEELANIIAQFILKSVLVVYGSETAIPVDKAREVRRDMKNLYFLEATFTVEVPVSKSRKAGLVWA